MLSPMMQCAGRIRVKDCPFGAPDGTSNQFQLVDRHGHAVTQDVRIASIHQTDWQGRVELSDQPRTNQFRHSNGLDQWSTTAAEISTSTEGVPELGQNLFKLTETTATSSHFIAYGQTYSTGQSYSYFCVAKAGERSVLQFSFSGALGGSQYANFDLAAGVVSAHASGTTATILSLGEGFYLCTATGRAANTGGGFMAFMLQESLTAGRGESYQGDGTSGLYIGVMQSEFASATGAYIPTIGQPVTVTDYTANANGQVVLGQVPADGATLDWSGTARRAA